MQKSFITHQKKLFSTFYDLFCVMPFFFSSYRALLSLIHHLLFFVVSHSLAILLCFLSFPFFSAASLFSHSFPVLIICLIFCCLFYVLSYLCFILCLFYALSYFLLSSLISHSSLHFTSPVPFCSPSSCLPSFSHFWKADLCTKRLRSF